jgi:glycosyltransferase involved in cell wall biosynthesis
VTLYTGPIDGDDPGAALDFYGVTPHENLRLQPFFPPSPEAPVADILRQVTPHWPESTVVMSRGESGLRVLPSIRQVAGGTTPMVYEAHRVCFDSARDQTRAVPAWKKLLQHTRVARLRRRERRVVESVDGLVCLTPGVERALTEHFHIADRPTLILPSGTDPTPPSGADLSGDGGRDLDVVYIGKLDERKGIGHLIRAMPHVAEASLWLVGPASEDRRRSLRRLAEETGLSQERLQMPGYIKPAEVRTYCARAKVGVCPLPAGISRVSEQFTSPMKIFDMMACGTPIVSTDLPSTRDVLRDQHNALLTPPNDPIALAAAIQRLLNDRVLAHRLAARAREGVLHYAWDNRAKRLLDFLRSLRPVSTSG